MGKKKLKRNDPTDWNIVWDLAKSNQIEQIPADIRVRCFHQIRSICSAFIRPVAKIRKAFVFWGPTRTGKSRRAWDEAGLTSGYAKCPRTKWWDGYQGERNVVIDEFRGDIGISNILRWLDRYPVSIERKGGSYPLEAETFWFTSNLDPRKWYPDLDEETQRALLARLEIHHFENPFERT